MGGAKNKQKVLHHGTILINTDLGAMQNYLNPNVMKLKSKGVSSVKQRVINLKDIKNHINVKEIIESISDSF